MDIQLAQSVIYQWFTKHVDIEAIWADQGQPRLNPPYGTLKILSGPTKIGHDNTDFNDDDEFEVCGYRELVISVNIYGEGSLQCMDLLQNSHAKPSIRSFLRTEGNLVIAGTGTIQNLTALTESQFLSRAQMDVTFRTASVTVDEDTTYIESVEITSENDGQLITVP